jgi:hypothetical protein
MVKGQQLTAYAMAQPRSWLMYIAVIHILLISFIKVSSIKFNQNLMMDLVQHLSEQTMSQDILITQEWMPMNKNQRK